MSRYRHIEARAEQRGGERATRAVIEKLRAGYDLAVDVEPWNAGHILLRSPDRRTIWAINNLLTFESIPLESVSSSDKAVST